MRARSFGFCGWWVTLIWIGLQDCMFLVQRIARESPTLIQYTRSSWSSTPTKVEPARVVSISERHRSLLLRAQALTIAWWIVSEWVEDSPRWVRSYPRRLMEVHTRQMLFQETWNEVPVLAVAVAHRKKVEWGAEMGGRVTICRRWQSLDWFWLDGIGRFPPWSGRRNGVLGLWEEEQGGGCVERSWIAWGGTFAFIESKRVSWV